MSSPGLIHFSSQQMDSAFSKGAVVYNGTPERSYQVHAARKNSTGEAEVHEHDTDIFHILEGAATLVTGGTVLEAQSTAQGETRGTSLRDGTSTPLAKGDVVIIPNGLPHWLTDVQGTLLYYVVKVRQQ
jgi:mannose-6-phosphate isomerase-like protein (cupin superfamily)